MKYYYFNLLFFTIFLAFLCLSCESDTIRRSDYEVEGIDISRYQGKLNWTKVTEEGIDFAYVKATEGLEKQDTMFRRNWSEMQRVNIKRGAYHFFRPTLSPWTQAQNFISTVDLETGDLPPVLDVEVVDGVSKAVLVSRMKSWLNIIELRYNTRPIIYTNLKFYYNYIVGNFDDYPLWIAKYGDIKPNIVNANQFKFWQYGNKGKLSGVNGFIDLNVFIGSKTDLEALCVGKNKNTNLSLSSDF
jgi:lysozyme